MNVKAHLVQLWHRVKHATGRSGAGHRSKVLRRNTVSTFYSLHTIRPVFLLHCRHMARFFLRKERASAAFSWLSSRQATATPATLCTSFYQNSQELVCRQ